MKDGKKEEKVEESWDKKRVGIALTVLLIVISGLLYLLNNKFLSNNAGQSTKVLSAKDVKLEDVVAGQIMSLKKQASNINVEEIASSSPQMKKLVEDL